MGGGPRQHAVGRVRDCGVECGDTPVNSFTEEPSRTNLNVAMEGIFASAGRAVLDLIKKAGELLMRLVRWIGDLLKKTFTKTQSNEEKIEKLAAVAEANEKIAEIIKAPNIDGSKAEHSPTMQRLHGALQGYEATHTALAAELLSRRGVLGPAMAGLCVELLHVQTLLEKKIDVFQAVLATPSDLPRETQAMTAIAQFNTIAEPISAGSLLHFLKSAHITVPAHSVTEAMDGLKAYVLHLNSRKVKAELPDVMIARLEERDHPIHQPILMAGGEFVAGFERMEGLIKRLTKIEATELATPEQAAALRKAQAVLKAEHEALADFSMAVAICEEARTNVLHSLLSYALARNAHQKAVLQNADLTPEQTNAFNAAMAEANRKAA